MDDVDDDWMTQTMVLGKGFGTSRHLRKHVRAPLKPRQAPEHSVADEGVRLCTLLRSLVLSTTHS